MPPVMQKAQQRIAGQHPRLGRPMPEPAREPEPVDQRIAPSVVSPHVEVLREQNELLRQQNEILTAIVERLDMMMSPERIISTVQGIGELVEREGLPDAAADAVEITEVAPAVTEASVEPVE